MLKKEIVDIFRDKKSMIATFLIPLIIYPLLFFILGGEFGNIVDKGENPYVAIVEVDGEAETVLSSSNENFNYIINEVINSDKVVTPTVKNYKTALIEGDLSLVIRYKKSSDSLKNIILNGGKINLEFVYDSRTTASSVALDNVMQKVGVYSQNVYNDRLGEFLSPEDILSLNAIDYSSVTEIGSLVERRKGVDSILLITIIPLLVTLLISVGGSTVAVDLTAGEKERNTFEPLLTTSASRFSILSAKYVAIILFSFISAFAQIVSMLIGLKFMPSEFMGGNLSLPFGAVMLCFVNVLLLACIFCSLMLCLSCTAKTFKEASSKTSILVFLPLILAYSTMLTDAVDMGMLYMIGPVINVVSVLKMTLSGVINYPMFLVSILVNVAYVIITVIITLKMFSKESLISRS